MQRRHLHYLVTVTRADAPPSLLPTLATIQPEKSFSYFADVWNDRRGYRLAGSLNRSLSWCSWKCVTRHCLWQAI